MFERIASFETELTDHSDRLISVSSRAEAAINVNVRGFASSLDFALLLTVGNAGMLFPVMVSVAFQPVPHSNIIADSCQRYGEV